MPQLSEPAADQVFIDSYELLNSAQREAVDAVEGPVMVLAGPGTGKTQILAMRVANLLRNPDLQLNPSNILCLTFTESATAAMRKRLISIIGSDAYYVRIHTFHSFCNEIIKDNPHKFFAINPISELEQIQIFNEILDDLDPTSPIKPFGDPYIYRNDLMNNIKTLKRESISAEKLEAAIADIERFLSKNSEHIEAFISRNARSIKEEECDQFIEKLHVLNPENDFVALIQDFRDRSERIAEFKKHVKDFYEKNLREIPKQHELVEVYRDYQAKLDKRKLYDFEDMILRVIKQFENDDELLGQYQEQFQYILVDEYQDTNGAQSKILDLLTSYYKNNPNLFVVGDDDQSIYRFQGASLENILYFHRRYQDFIKIVVLKENYRSQQNILDLASRSINVNSARVSKLIPSISKQLNSAGVAKDFDLEAVEIFKTNNLQDEIYHIGKRVKELIDSGVSPNEVAVLFRENKSADDLINTFSRLQIPCRIEAGNNILDDHYISQLIDLLKVIENPEQNSALLFNVLNYDFILQSKLFQELGLVVRSVFELNARRRSKDLSQQSLIEFLLEDEKFKAFAELIIKFKQESVNVRLDDLVERIVKDFGYLDFVLAKPDYVQHINRLDSFFAQIRSLIESPLLEFSQRTLKQIVLADFLKHIELIQSNNLKIKAKALNFEANAVKLMTAHKAKGLEFEHVFVHACLDKKWGNKVTRSKLKLPPKLVAESEVLLHGDANEDERRLFFVALTRAKKKLYLAYHCKNDKDQELVPSLFVSELETIESSMINTLDYTQPDHEKLAKFQELEKLQLNFTSKIDEALTIEKDYIDELLGNYKLSVTHLNNYLDCHRKFFYQNLLRVPAAKNKHACFGTAVHAALYDMFQQAKGTKMKGEAYLLERFEEHLEAQRLPEQDHQDSLGFGKKILKEYLDHYGGSFNTEVLLEHDFSTMGVNLDGIELTGKLDKIEINGDKVNVVDYKTGNPSSKSSALKAGGDYHRQIVFYQMLCDLAKQAAQFKYDMVSGEIDFIQPAANGKYIKSRIEVTKSDLDILSTEIKDMYEKIHQHDFEMTDDHSKCKTCAFKNICKR